MAAAAAAAMVVGGGSAVTRSSSSKIPEGPVQEFHTYLQRRTASVSSFELANKTVELLRDIITQKRWSTAKDLMALIRNTGKILATDRPNEAPVGNMIRRGLRLVREAYAQCVTEAASSNEQPVQTMTSLHDLLVAPEEVSDYSTPFKALKSNVIQALNDLLEELQESTHNIAIQALEHIHADEVIMVMGRSRTVEAFLKAAARLRKFQVIVAECAPSFQGQEMALELAKAGIETTVITDSAVFAMMSRVNKVIVGTCVVMADGGLMALNGVHALALAAKHHSVPVVVCAAIFKLCPRYVCTYDQDMFNSLCSPEAIQDYSDAKIVSEVALANPLFDYVPPDLITLFISNLGGNAPSYTYRLLSEYYHEDDYEL